LALLLSLLCFAFISTLLKSNHLLAEINRGLPPFYGGRGEVLKYKKDILEAKNKRQRGEI